MGVSLAELVSHETACGQKSQGHVSFDNEFRVCDAHGTTFIAYFYRHGHNGLMLPADLRVSNCEGTGDK